MKYFTVRENTLDGTISIDPVETAHPFEYKGIELFAHLEHDKWKVTEKTSGLLVVEDGKSKEHIIDLAKFTIDKFSVDKIKSSIKNGYEQNRTEIDKFLGVVTIKRMVIQ